MDCTLWKGVQAGGTLWKGGSSTGGIYFVEGGIGWEVLFSRGVPSGRYFVDCRRRYKVGGTL